MAYKRVKTGNTRVFAVVKINSHFETIELDEKNSSTIYWLMVTASKKLDEMFSEDACTNAIGFLKAKYRMNEKIQSEEIHFKIVINFDFLNGFHG